MIWYNSTKSDAQKPILKINWSYFRIIRECPRSLKTPLSQTFVDIVGLRFFIFFLALHKEFAILNAMVLISEMNWWKVFIIVFILFRDSLFSYDVLEQFYQE